MAKSSPQSVSQIVETNTKAINVLRYPLDMTGKSAHILSFEIIRSKGSQFIKGPSNQLIENPEAVSNDTVKADTNKTPKLKGANLSVVDTIHLYMPDTISDSSSHDWNSTELGAAGRIDNLVSNAAGGNFTDTFAQTKESLKRIGSRGVQGVSDLNLNDIVEKNTGLIANPYLEMLYKGSTPKQYTFEFKFTPKSQREVDEVDRIVKTLRFHAAPEYRTGSDHSFMVYPSFFRPKFLFNAIENPYIHKLGMSALTAVDVNVTGQGEFTSFANGAPVETHVTLQFSEISVQTKNDIQLANPNIKF